MNHTEADKKLRVELQLSSSFGWVLSLVCHTNHKPKSIDGCDPIHESIHPQNHLISQGEWKYMVKCSTYDLIQPVIFFLNFTKE